MSPVLRAGGTPKRSTIAVISLRDCGPDAQADCIGSGKLVASLVARLLNRNPRWSAIPVSRPAAANAVFSDAEARAYALTKGFPYVVNGEVSDYGSGVAPMVFRSALTLSLVRASDGQTVAFYSDRRFGLELFQTPESVLEGMAQHFVESLDPNDVKEKSNDIARTVKGDALVKNKTCRKQRTIVCGECVGAL